MLRRQLLAALAAAQSKVQRKVFVQAPGNGVAVMAYAYYSRATGLDMVSIEQRWSRSDTIDVAYRRTSSDNGRTWSKPEEQWTGRKTPEGMLRRHLRAGYVDPHTKRLLEFWMEAVLPTDDPLEGLRRYAVYYSIDGSPGQQVIQSGPGLDATHPIPGSTLGINGYMLGDNGSVPITAPNGDLLLPLEIFPARDGKLYNPGGGYTWSNSGVMRGHWRRGELEWTLAAVVEGDPARTTRGMVEPTLAFLDRRRVLMVMRGSNDRNPKLPAHKWYSLSTDGGRTFGPDKPWTDTEGVPFFSPSACSRLLAHSNGRLYWLGNITPVNPRGNRPRYPFVLAEVDRRSGLLIRSSIVPIDTRQPGEDEILSLSNFYALEDRETREIVLYMTRLFAFPAGWQGDSQEYRIAV